VVGDALIDQEDAHNKAYIFSDDAINLLWELPQLGQSAFGAVAYQHLLNHRIAEVLAKKHYLNQAVLLKGDDMMVQRDTQATADLGKCSVSITHVKDQVALGHTGINIVAGEKAPAEAFSTRLNDIQVDEFIEEILQLFYRLNRELFTATCKVLV
jgi:hypothetical protein